MIDSLEIVLEKDLPDGKPDRLKVSLVLDGVLKGAIFPLPSDYQTNPARLFHWVDRAMSAAVRTVMKEEGVGPYDG